MSTTVLIRLYFQGVLWVSCWKQISSSIWGDGRHPGSLKTLALRNQNALLGQHTRPGRNVMYIYIYICICNMYIYIYICNMYIYIYTHALCMYDNIIYMWNILKHQETSTFIQVGVMVIEHESASCHERPAASAASAWRIPPGPLQWTNLAAQFWTPIYGSKLKTWWDPGQCSKDSDLYIYRMSLKNRISMEKFGPYHPD